MALALFGAGCGVDVLGPDPPTDRLVYPVGMALHPEGRYLYVVNSNFDVEFRQDRGGTVTVVDTDSLALVPEQTAQIGTFAGDIKLNSPSDGSPTKAYVAVRGDKSVTALDLSATGELEGCGGSQFTAACQMATASDDPFGLVVRTTDQPIGGGEATTPLDFVAVAHLVGSNITAFAIRGDDVKGVNRVSSPLVAGANAIARSPRTGHYYATSRFTNTVVSFRPSFDDDGELEAVFQLDEVTIENATPYSGLDSRGLAFNSAGTELYVASRGPNSLLIIDVGPSNAETGGGSRNQVVDLIPLPSSPSEVSYLELGQEDPEGYIYVTSYNQRIITVLDPDSRRVLTSIDIPGRPYAIATDQVRHQRMYVSLFDSHSIAVIDIDPASPSFNEVVSVVK